MHIFERLRARFSKQRRDSSSQALSQPKNARRAAPPLAVGLLHNLLWLTIPLYLGYALWPVLLPAPTLRYQPNTAPPQSIAALIQATGWYQAAPAATPTNTEAAPTLTVNTKITLQGVFVRAKFASVAIIAHDGVTEVAVQDQPTKTGYILRQARPFEIDMEDAAGQRFLVKMAAKVNLSDLYQKSDAPTPFAPRDVFVPNDSLNLRPINPNIPSAGVVMMPPPTEFSSPTTTSLPDPAFPSNQPNIPLAQEVVTGETLPPEIGRLLYVNPRYLSLSEEKKTQLRNLMAAPQFSEAVRDNPDVLNQLIDSFPVEVGH